jgi:hypothetical protein
MTVPMTVKPATKSSAKLRAALFGPDAGPEWSACAGISLLFRK